MAKVTNETRSIVMKIAQNIYSTKCTDILTDEQKNATWSKALKSSWNLYKYGWDVKLQGTEWQDTKVALRDEIKYISFIEKKCRGNGKQWQVQGNGQYNLGFVPYEIKFVLKKFYDARKIKATLNQETLKIQIKIAA